MDLQLAVVVDHAHFSETGVQNESEPATLVKLGLFRSRNSGRMNLCQHIMVTSYRPERHSPVSLREWQNQE
jgi:hypothetical protein